MRPIIIVVEDPETGARSPYAFLRSPVRIGRDPECDLVLEDPAVGALHGLVQFDEREAWYTDLGTPGGTAVQGRRLASSAPLRLEPGAVLSLGEVHLSFERGAPLGISRATYPPTRPSTVSGFLRQMSRIPDEAEGDLWAARLHPGLSVNRFELVRELGRGGFGVVYEAADGELGRTVALKLVKPGTRIAARGGQWLLREAEAVARLNHPNIVTLHDLGQGQTGAYLVFELLRGRSLAARLRDGPITPDEVIDVGIAVARALVHAHGAGVIHRDLTAANVHLTEEGGVKVLDFGLAHLFGRDGANDGGTPAYMAPEQWEGDQGDARTDLFALGVILFQECQGTKPAARVVGVEDATQDNVFSEGLIAVNKIMLKRGSPIYVEFRGRPSGKTIKAQEFQRGRRGGIAGHHQQEVALEALMVENQLCLTPFGKQDVRQRSNCVAWRAEHPQPLSLAVDVRNAGPTHDGHN